MKNYFVNMLSKNDLLLIKSADEYSFQHYIGSPLNVLTGFSGTAGEAILNKSGEIFLFVDPRYHEQADSQTQNHSDSKNIKVIKLGLGESFSDAIKNMLSDNSIFYMPYESITKIFFDKLKKNLNKKIELKGYATPSEFSHNKERNKAAPIFGCGRFCGGNFSQKFEELKKYFKKDINNFLITNIEDIAWLTGLRSFQMPYASTFYSKMVIAGNEAYLFCDDRHCGWDEYNVLPLEEFKTFVTKICEPTYVDCSCISVQDFDLVKNPICINPNPLALMASIKSPQETKHYKQSFKRLDDALFEFKKQIKAGLNELELKNIFEKALINCGAQTPSFKTILAIADNSSSIHYCSWDDKKILQDGNLILLDCGGYYEGGLATDITRVFLCGEKAEQKQKEIYTAVLKAFLNAYHSDAKTGCELDSIARKILTPYEAQGFYFPHALGHGIGVMVHQAPPYISSTKNFDTSLKKGMVHTIEPGLYNSNGDGFNKFGIRLENTVLAASENTRESLSKFPFEEKLIDFDMLDEKEKQWLNNWQEKGKEYNV